MFLDFSFLKKKDVLIYDGASLAIFKYIFTKNKYNVYFNRGEKINIWIFLTTIVQFKFKNYFELKKQYKINFISACSPKVIITFIDNNPSFYELKNLFPHVITISIQNGARNSNDLKIFNRKKNYTCDYFFVFSKSHRKFFSKIIKSNYIDSGSLKMNYYNKRNFKRKNEILFISQTANSAKTIERIEKYIIKNLINICKRNKIIFNILCKKNIKNILSNEIRDIKPENILESDGNFFSYEIIQKYNLKIFLNSTLGLESLAIGEKSYSIPLGCYKKHVNKFRLEKKVEKFGFPLKLPEQGYCWDNDFIHSRVEQKLVHLFNLKYSRWNRIHNKKKKFMNYDKKNTKLKNILKKFKIDIN